MPPPRRGTRRRRTAAAVAEDDDDGVPLNDESLLLVFSALSSSTADLIRCATTCRRWRRLVSADAAFICHRRLAPPPRSDDPFIPNLALGFFFHHSPTNAAAAGPPQFVPLSAAGTRLQPSLAALVDGASRVVASRGGRIVLDLLRRASSRVTNAVKLAVCHPVTIAGSGGGGVDVLPPLRGKDSPAGPYACTVITGADEDAGDAAASYRVLLLYNRRTFTALRCYSSGAGVWGPEAVVTGARIRRNHLAAVGHHAAVVHDGFMFWPRLSMAVRLDSLSLPPPPPPAVPTAAAKNKGKTPTTSWRHTVAGFSLAERLRPSRKTMQVERLIGVMPDGRMLRVEADNETIRAYWGGGAGDGGLMGEKLKWRWTMKQGLMGVHGVKLRWLCEKSGLVIFTARNNNGYGEETHVYTVDVETKQLRRAATCSEPALGEMMICGYEMDQVTLLASLAL